MTTNVSRWTRTITLTAAAAVTLGGWSASADEESPQTRSDASARAMSGQKTGLPPMPRTQVAARGRGPAVLYKQKNFRLDGASAGGGVVLCHKPGYRAVGGGVQTPTLREIVNESRPYDSPHGDKMPDNGWIAYIINPSPDPIKFRVYVVCHKG